MHINTDQVLKWDRIIRKFGEIDSKPEQEVDDFLVSDNIEPKSSGLDVGCGCGRHAIAAVRMGHLITAVDWSGIACVETQRRAQNNRIKLDVCRASMEELPFFDRTFDFAISWCVMNHGIKQTFERAVGEIFRVLRHGGILFGLIMTAEDDRYGQGREVEEDCYTFDAGLEEGIVHYFPDREEAVELLARHGQVDELRDLTFSSSEIAEYHPLAERSCHLMFQIRKRCAADL